MPLIEPNQYKEPKKRNKVLKLCKLCNNKTYKLYQYHPWEPRELCCFDCHELFNSLKIQDGVEIATEEVISQVKEIRFNKFKESEDAHE